VGRGPRPVRIVRERIRGLTRSVHAWALSEPRKPASLAKEVLIESR
jgi:hypothetical protein